MPSRPETDEKAREFLHRGIAERAFDLRFQLAEYVEVTGASLENGLLHVELKRELPESKKARTIAINGAAPKTIENSRSTKLPVTNGLLQQASSRPEQANGIGGAGRAARAFFVQDGTS